MNLEIDNNNIEKSFDRIARDLLVNNALYVNGNEFRITEIEFYYFHENSHRDNYTHEHKRNVGEWRFHNQGLDITFQSNDKSDGGILIRGVLHNGKYINGPRKILGEIFEAFGKVDTGGILKLKQVSSIESDIYKTFRHLPNKHIEKAFHFKPYRYIIDLENLDIPNTLKSAIKKDLTKL